MRRLALTILAGAGLMFVVGGATLCRAGDWPWHFPPNFDPTADPPAEDTRASPPPGPRYRDPAPKVYMRPSDLHGDVERPPAPPHQPTFSERYPTYEKYEAEVLGILNNAADTKGMYNADSRRAELARIAIRPEFESEHEPAAAATRVSGFVEKALQEQQNRTEARKKASQRVAKRPSVLQEAVADPELSRDAQPNYGEVASTALGIAGAFAPMLGRLRVPTATVRAPAPNIRAPAPAATVRAPIVRAPTGPQSDITGLGR